MGQWKKKSGRRLRDVTVTLKRDMRWASRFIQLAAEKHGRTAGDLFRNAFCVRFANRPDIGFVGGAGPVEKNNWHRIPLRIPERMAWMGAAIEDESKRQNCSPPIVLFIAFCEVYGAEFPELRELYEKWREVNQEAA